jgi:hypothetical protein
MIWQDPKAPEEAEVEAKLPEYPRMLFRGKRSAKERWRSASISLDGLLDYDEEVFHAVILLSSAWHPFWAEGKPVTSCSFAFCLHFILPRELQRVAKSLSESLFAPCAGP